MMEWMVAPSTFSGSSAGLLVSTMDTTEDAVKGSSSNGGAFSVVAELMVSGRVHGHAVKGSNSNGGAFSVVR
jgi:hypothetical protein